MFVCVYYSLIWFNCSYQRGPTTFDLRAILQKRDNSRITANNVVYKIID